MARSKLIAIRTDTRTAAWITVEAQRVGRTEEAFVANMVEEEAQMRRYHGIGFRGPDHDRQAWVMSTAFDVWEVIQAYLDCDRSIDTMLEVGNLPEATIRLALSYYRAYPDQIDATIAENNAPEDVWRQRYPELLLKPARPGETSGGTVG